MVRARHPARRVTRVAHLFIAVKFPGDIAFPVHLDKVRAVLHAMFAAAAATAGQQIAARENLVGHPVNTFPDIHLTAVHIHKDGSDFLRLKNRKTVPASFGIVDGYTSGINGRMAHDMLLNL